MPPGLDERVPYARNEAYVKELLGEGYELFIQMIPADAKTDAAKVIG